MPPLSRQIRKRTSEKWKYTLIEFICAFVILVTIFIIADLIGINY